VRVRKIDRCRERRERECVNFKKSVGCRSFSKINREENAFDCMLQQVHHLQ